MNRIATISALFVTLIAASAVAQEPSAEPAVEESSTIGVDIEIDPIAYVASGYSLHVGLTDGRYRLDLGAFAADLPEFVHGNEGFDMGFHGFGTKFDVFLFDDEQLGPFAGVELALNKRTVVDRETQIAGSTRFVQTGLRVGWRIGLPADFFVVPWVGLGYAFDTEDELVGGRTFEQSEIVVFPTIHLGYRF
jgi:hypothetical protein